MSIVLGLDAKLYRNAASYASPSWDEVANVRDVQLQLEKQTTDVTTRGGNGWVQNAATLKDATVTFSMIWSPGDADFEAFRDAFINNTLIDCWVLDGDNVTSGNQGLRAEMEVTSFTRNENLTEALTTDVTLKPGRGTAAPAWSTV